MPSGSVARERMRIELWSWSAWLVLCIVSYPALALLWFAPRAGLVSALAAGAFLVVTAGFGHARRRGWSSLGRLVMVAFGAAGAAGALAFVADRVDLVSAALCGVAAGAEIVFIGRFLPWIAADAEMGDGASGESVQLMPRGRRAAHARGGLAFALMLAFLTLGLGAAWSRGERWAPDPTAWAVAVVLLALGLMFVERVSSLSRSSLSGNLRMPRESYRRWIAAAVIAVALCAAVAAIAPLRSARERQAQTRTGSATAAGEAAQPAPSRAQDLAARASAGLRAVALWAQGAPRGVLALWLLFLLLLLLAVMIWGFRRSRPTRLLLRLLARLVAAWERAMAALRRWLTPPPTARAPARAAPLGDENPFFDVFEHPDVIGRLSPREAIIRTYHLVLNTAEMLGHGRARGQTPFEYAHTIRETAPRATEPMMVLTWAYANAMYGGPAATLPDLSLIRRSWHQVEESLAAGVSPEDLDLRRRAYLAARKLEAGQR